jgi:hypothetical protein
LDDVLLDKVETTYWSAEAMYGCNGGATKRPTAGTGVPSEKH